MSNPWLKIPLADYEGHMKSLEQLSALSDLFAEALEFCRPASVAILGIAGGNGLERIDDRVTSRVAGLDLNPAYLDAVRERYPNVRGLELGCVDLANEAAKFEPFELVHAALVLEHAGTERCLENAISLVGPGGALSVALQLPSTTEANVAASGYASIQELKSHFALVDRAWLRATLEGRGFTLVREAERPLPAGKGFWMGIFRR